MNESPRRNARDPQESADGLFASPTPADTFSFDDLDSHRAQDTVSKSVQPVDSEPLAAEAIEWADDDNWVDPEDAFEDPLLLGADAEISQGHTPSRFSRRNRDEPPREMTGMVKGLWGFLATAAAVSAGIRAFHNDHPEPPDYPYSNGEIVVQPLDEHRYVQPSFEESPFYTSGQDIWETRPDGLLPRQRDYEAVGSTAPFLPDRLEADPVHASATSLFPEAAPLTPPPQRGPFDELQFDSDPLFGGSTETASDFAFTNVSAESDSAPEEVVPVSNQFLPPRVASPSRSSANTPMRPARSEAPLLPDSPAPLE